ncbi:hypothetical protein M9458_052686 [Cirrhinus mrigala]|uniref:Retrotransposon gag domain-containing protein n=1 Tax=Cirrhinus mrigala TaxID=683832 RepID=A0ABD0MV34_CIRMR
MDHASSDLRQGNQPIEDYAVDFCELCHLVGFNDIALKDIFQHGLKNSLNYLMPHHTPHWTLEQYIDFALLLAGSPFTVGVADDQPCNPTFPTTPKPAQVTSTKPETSHAKPAKPKPAHAMPAAPGPAHAMPALPESAPVMAAIPKPVHKMATIPKSVHKMAAPSESPAKPHQSKIISSKSHLAVSATPKANGLDKQRGHSVLFSYQGTRVKLGAGTPKVDRTSKMDAKTFTYKIML